MESWYNVVTPRPEVLAGRSFSPDEFAIALEQVVAGTAPDDYCRPDQFFDRTCFTPELVEQAGLVLRRLAGETQNTAPVLSLVSGFGGGKTHTLATLFHLVRAAGDATPWSRELLPATGLDRLPLAAVGVFVGNAWDPEPGRETPWIDLARQIAGDAGVAALGMSGPGTSAASRPPGTDALGRVFAAAGRPVLILCDEVINFTARHPDMAEDFLAFLHNLTVTLTGTSCGAAVVSLPQNAVEMTERDQAWHERLTKVVRRVARDLIGGDSGDSAEIIRRRLFADPGPEETRQQVASAYATWCLSNRERLPADWCVGSSGSRAEHQQLLTDRFAACYPFHPATLSVFSRKWSGLPQFQQTRGMLAIFARWIAETYERVAAGAEPAAEALITLGTAPLHDTEFRRTVFGQLGVNGLDVSVDADIVQRTSDAGSIAAASRADVLDADTEGLLRSIHRRVATTVFFESAGGADRQIARLPELRLALGEPHLETTTVDTAAFAVEADAHFLHRSGGGGDGYRVSTQAKIDRAVIERRASLDHERNVRPELHRLITESFQPSDVPIVFFPADSSSVPDAPRLTLVVADPDDPWTGNETQQQRVSTWMRSRGESPRLFPGGLLWCFRRPGLVLQDCVESLLAWRIVAQELQDGVIGPEYEPGSLPHVAEKLQAAEARAREEVRNSYQTIVLTNQSQPNGLQVFDSGGRTAASGESLSIARRVLVEMCDSDVVSRSVSAAYLQRGWPPVFGDSRAWPLLSLRQSFFDGSLTRLLDAESSLRECIASGVAAGEFGLATGSQSDGSFARVWLGEACPPEQIRFEADCFLVAASRAASAQTVDTRTPDAPSADRSTAAVPYSPEAQPGASGDQIHVTGSIPPEQWNRIGTRLLARLRSAGSVRVDVSITAECEDASGHELVEGLRQTLDELGLSDSVDVQIRPAADVESERH